MKKRGKCMLESFVGSDNERVECIVQSAKHCCIVENGFQNHTHRLQLALMRRGLWGATGRGKV